MNFSKDLIILSSSFVKECILPDSGHRELRGTFEIEIIENVVIVSLY